MVELLKSVEVVIGIIVAVVGGGAASLTWFWRRVSDKVDNSVDPLSRGNASIVDRLEQVEREQTDLRDRMGSIENRMALLATKDDVGQLYVAVARIEERGTKTDGMVDTIYRAIMERSRRE